MNIRKEMEDKNKVAGRYKGEHKIFDGKFYLLLTDVDEAVQQAKLEECKKTLEEVWGLINEKLDTMDINTQELEMKTLLEINKKIDVGITKLSKLKTK